jgi:hypothetical protein
LAKLALPSHLDQQPVGLLTSTQRHVLGDEGLILGPGFLHQCESQGFCDGEGEGAWTREEFAWIRLRLPEETCVVGFELTFKLPPHPQGRPQRLKVLVNGLQVFNGLVRPWALQRIFRTCSVVDATADWTVIFLTERCLNPLQLGIADDPRDLGVMVSRIRLSPVRRRRLRLVLAREQMKRLFSPRRGGLLQ